jgi:Skp family chaperone for outer membrane proteins
MNRNFSLLTVLAAGIFPLAMNAQVSPAPPAAAPAPAAPQQPAQVQPQAIPAKIALVAFETAVVETNEGQRAVDELRKQYEPKKAKLDELGNEIESLKKQLQAMPATSPEQERASRAKTIDTKEKQYQRDVDDAQTAYQADLQEAYGKVAQKVDVVMKNYVKNGGFTLLLNVGGEQSPVMWAVPETDITEAVILAYNASTPGITAPPPPAPSAAPRPAPPKAAPTAPRTAPKPPTQ